MNIVFRIRTSILNKLISNIFVRRIIKRPLASSREIGMDQNSSSDKTKKFWDKESGTWEIGKGIHWTELIAVHERLNRKM